MYTSPAGLILGFHGCDKKVGEAVLAGKIIHLSKSENVYDWLGHGIYFWENNPERALSYARELMHNPLRKKNKIEEPFVLGAVIDPGHCLNLMEATSLRLLKKAYHFLRDANARAGIPMPENKLSATSSSSDLLRRNLDCAVMETLHTLIVSQDRSAYDTVRGVFTEGLSLYPNSGFREKDHVQLCVRNPMSIKGYFRLLPNE